MMQEWSNRKGLFFKLLPVTVAVILQECRIDRFFFGVWTIASDSVQNAAQDPKQQYQGKLAQREKQEKTEKGDNDPGELF